MVDPREGVPDTTQRSSFAFLLLLAATAVATSAHSAAMPFLAGLVEQAGADLDSGTHARHVAALAAAFPIAGLVCAPLWGWLSDRRGRKLVLLLGLAGFGISAGLFGRGTLEELYLFRVLNGAFSAAIIPVAFAFVSDRALNPVEKTRRFTWLNAFFFVGELSGPLLGEVSASVGLPVPLAIPAAMMLIVAAAALLSDFSEAAPLAQPEAIDRQQRPGSMLPILLIAGVAAAGLSSLHLVLLLREQPGHLSRDTISYLLSLCGFAMLAAQVTHWHTRRLARQAQSFVRPMLLALFIALVTVNFASSHWVLALVILVAGWAAATLRLVTSLLCAGAESRIVGLRLGLQHAATSAGQAAASASTAWLGAGSEAMTVGLAAGAALLMAVFAPAFLLARPARKVAGRVQRR